MPKRLEGIAYLALAMVLVGSTVSASKVLAAGLPPFTATALRFAIAFPLFLVVMRVTRTRWPKLARADWTLLFLQAGAGSVGYTTLLISGLRHTSAGDAGVIIGTLPVVSAMIAVVVLGERPGSAVLVAIALATAGVFSIAFRADDDGARVSGAEASLLTALAPVSAVIFAATLLGEPVGTQQMIGIGCVLVAVLSLGLARATQPMLRRRPRPDLSTKAH